MNKCNNNTIPENKQIQEHCKIYFNFFNQTILTRVYKTLL